MVKHFQYRSLELQEKYAVFQKEIDAFKGETFFEINPANKLPKIVKIAMTANINPVLPATPSIVVKAGTPVSKSP